MVKILTIAFLPHHFRMISLDFTIPLTEAKFRLIACLSWLDIKQGLRNKGYCLGQLTVSDIKRGSFLMLQMARKQGAFSYTTKALPSQRGHFTTLLPLCVTIREGPFHDTTMAALVNPARRQCAVLR